MLTTSFAYEEQVCRPSDRREDTYAGRVVIHQVMAAPCVSSFLKIARDHLPTNQCELCSRVLFFGMTKCGVDRQTD